VRASRLTAVKVINHKSVRTLMHKAPTDSFHHCPVARLKATVRSRFPRVPTPPSGRTLVTLAVGVVLIPLGCGSRVPTRHAHAQPAVGPHRLGGVIVFRRFFDAAHHSGAIFSIRTDGTGQRQLSHPPAGSVDALNGPPSSTHDGSTLVFARTDSSGQGSLWTVRTNARAEHPLHFLSGMPGDGWPVVSPDGRHIAVARAWGKPDAYQDLKTALYVLRLDGTSPRLVASFGYRADVGGATWSPDGRRLVFSVFNNGPGQPAAASALFVVSAAGRNLRRITGWNRSARLASPAFSHDGSEILFQTKPTGQDFGGNYFTIRPNGADPRRLTAFATGSALGSAAFSPDGKWIVFANTGVGGNDDLFIMRADGTHISPLTRTASWESAATWVP
jgi:TolB protein